MEQLFLIRNISKLIIMYLRSLHLTLNIQYVQTLVHYINLLDILSPAEFSAAHLYTLIRLLLRKSMILTAIFTLMEHL